MQAGELIVTGKDKAIIPLHGLPLEVKVRFRNPLDHVPCNPQHEDCLEYEVQSSGHHHHHSHHCGFVLVIKWHVSGVREIVWRVHY